MEQKIIDYIKEKNMIKPGEVIGVAVSGGADSMCLLSILNNIKEDLDISIVAITIDHMLRGANSIEDANFVKDYCREHNILCWKFSVDAFKLASNKGVGIEEGARLARYGVFDKLLSERVDKIALAHHISDQAETILMNILRGAGLNGASGMEEVSQGKFIRPLLNVSKEEILSYCLINDIKFVEDETNSDTTYNRNFLRNVILPQLKQRWEGVEQNLVNFSKTCKEDNDFILSHVSCSGIIYGDDLVKIPLFYFHYEPSIINRIIFSSLNKINVFRDIERKHIEMIKDLTTADNGKKINLPNELVAVKEYSYICLYKEKKKEVIIEAYPFKCGKIKFADSYEIVIKRTTDFTLCKDYLLIDANKLPANCVIRSRKTGDKFTKFGGGSKSLKNYLIDKKVPSRLRDLIPVIASDNQIYAVLGIEIGDSVKIDENSKYAYKITCKELVKKDK